MLLGESNGSWQQKRFVFEGLRLGPKRVCETLGCAYRCDPSSWPYPSGTRPIDTAVLFQKQGKKRGVKCTEAST